MVIYSGMHLSHVYLYSEDKGQNKPAGPAVLANVNTDLAAFILGLLCLRQVYRWTGDNMFFIKGDMDSLAFGGGRCVRNA